MKQKQGGQKTNVSAHLGECLALLYLQAKYRGTIIKFNHSQDQGERPHDIEQYTRDAAWLNRIGCEERELPPECIWEVKSLSKRNKWFKIRPERHRKLMRQRPRKRYVFVLFHHPVDLKYFPHTMPLTVSLQELPATRVSELLRKAKYIGREQKVSFRAIFPRDAYTTTPRRARTR